MKPGIKKFLSVCAIVAGAGIVLSVVGYFTGGIDGVGEMSQKYSWIKGPAGDREYTYLPEGETFTSVKVNGDIDVNISEGSSETKAAIGHGENIGMPRMYVEDGVLIVNAETDSPSVGLDFSGENAFPVLEIYCRENAKLQNIDIDISYGDVGIENVSCGSMNIATSYGNVDIYNTELESGKILTDYGDVSGESIVSGGLDITAELGDCSLQGVLRGKTGIRVDSGDVDVESSLSEVEYKVSVDAEAGDLTIGNNEFDNFSNHYSRGEGPNAIEIVSELGDVEIGFGI